MAERRRPLFSIGAVARMVNVSAATIRTWEARYGLVTPQRSEGGQRLYSREQVDQLRFVKEQMAAGRRPGEAHRILAERLSAGTSRGSGMRVLLAQSKLGAAKVLKDILGRDALGEINGDTAGALIVVESGDVDLDELSERLRRAGNTIRSIETA